MRFICEQKPISQDDKKRVLFGFAKEQVFLSLVVIIIVVLKTKSLHQRIIEKNGSTSKTCCGVFIVF